MDTSINLENYSYEIGYKKDGYFKRNIYKKVMGDYSGDIGMFRVCTNNTDLYVSVYSSPDWTVDDPIVLGDLTLDFDSEIKDENEYKKLSFEVRLVIQYLKSYLGIEAESINMYFSGAKGFHLVIPYKVLGVLPSTTLNVRYKAFAKKLIKECGLKTLDLKIYDKKRLFRLPNTINSKSGLYKVPVTVEQLYSSSYEEIKEYAKEIKEEIKKVETKTKKETVKKFNSIAINEVFKREKKNFNVPEVKKPLLSCAEKLLKEGIGSGQRNNATIALSSSLLQSGLSMDEAYNAILEWNELNSPPLEERELMITFNSALNMLNSGRTYGCCTYKDLGMCVEDCSLLKK